MICEAIASIIYSTILHLNTSLSCMADYSVCRIAERVQWIDGGLNYQSFSSWKGQQFFLPPSMQTGYEPHLTSFSGALRGFSRRVNGQDIKPNTHSHLVPNMRMSGAIHCLHGMCMNDYFYLIVLK